MLFILTDTSVFMGYPTEISYVNSSHVCTGGLGFIGVNASILLRI